MQGKFLKPCVLCKNQTNPFTDTSVIASTLGSKYKLHLNSRNGFEANTDRLTKSWENLEIRKFIMYVYKFGWYYVIVSMFSLARQVHLPTSQENQYKICSQ